MLDLFSKGVNIIQAGNVDHRSTLGDVAAGIADINLDNLTSVLWDLAKDIVG